ncbi:MAG: aminodeoxychorismate synthase component I [Methylocystaceae bacterium]|nr:aminodeoxychorismate synthase component I [Methylocystaceae bacterium]
MKTPIVLDIPFADPAKLFAPFASQPFAQFLDSAGCARYSYICLHPSGTFEDPNHILPHLRETLQDITLHEGLPPFQGGLVGFIGYEWLHQLEDISPQKTDDLSLPDVCFGFYDTIAAFDHKEEKAWIFSIKNNAAAHALKEQLYQKTDLQEYTPVSLNWVSDFTAQTYQDSVQRVIDYILEGDIFQANLTQRFQASLPDGFKRYSFYQNLRKTNPAPFSAYLNFKDFTIASSSPERFLEVAGKQVETCPIKGTRARSTDPVIDEANALALQKSEKDRAENTMIVDLLRNDLSKVCTPHSVHVPELCGLHSFASVHHLISTILGELKEGCDSLDLLEACFPGGSITGAPKVRAMEIISELEPVRRNLYCGTIGYIGYDGRMDTNIVIRTVIFKGDKACVQVGGGIVADSDPESEYLETLDKARALFSAFDRCAS